MQKKFHKKRQEVFLYQMVFLALGSLFIFAGNHLLFNGHHLHLPVYGQLAGQLRALISLSAFIMGLSSLWIGCSLRTADELLREFYLTHKRIIDQYANGRERENRLQRLAELARHYKQELQECHDKMRKIEILNEAKASLEKVSELLLTGP